jgi:carbon-monoxide dehydrogenase large subunit
MIGHGDIRSIGLNAALAAPGILAIYTGEDLVVDGIGNVPCVPSVKNRDGGTPYTPPHPPLCVGRIRGMSATLSPS